MGMKGTASRVTLNCECLAQGTIILVHTLEVLDKITLNYGQFLDVQVCEPVNVLTVYSCFNPYYYYLLLKGA